MTKGSKMTDRNDPKQNKSLAIRTVLADGQNMSTEDVIANVKFQFGHHVSANMVYRARNKLNSSSPKRIAKSVKKGTTTKSDVTQMVKAVGSGVKFLEDCDKNLEVATKLLGVLSTK